MIKQRSAIERSIEHMKTDGRRSHHPLNSALGDALHAVMCGAGHHIHLLQSTLRLLCAAVATALLDWLAAFAATPVNRIPPPA